MSLTDSTTHQDPAGFPPSFPAGTAAPYAPPCGGGNPKTYAEHFADCEAACAEYARLMKVVNLAGAKRAHERAKAAKMAMLRIENARGFKT